MLANGATKKKIIIVASLFCLMIGAVIIFVCLKKDDTITFDESEKAFFQMFSRMYTNPDNYKITSLDAYYYAGEKDSDGMYYFHFVYSAYSEIEESWMDIDEVDYGPIGIIYNVYSLSWGNLEGTGFEKVNEEFQQAVKNGVHKSYDVSKFQEYLDKYKDED